MSRLTIVLVEPQIPANIGMVCRAMANFDVDRLRLVNPCDYRDPMASRLAVAAAPLLDSAQCFDSLEEALADMQLTVAATRRSGRHRGELQELSSFAATTTQSTGDIDMALVFGREDSGLTREEVELCQHAVSVNTASSLGSLNLAQAVLLFLYELSSPPPTAVTTRRYPRHAEINAFCSEVETLLQRIAFLNPQRPDAIMQPLKRMLARANPDHDEFNLLRGMFSHLAASANDWRGKRRGKG